MLEAGFRANLTGSHLRLRRSGLNTLLYFTLPWDS